MQFFVRLKRLFIVLFIFNQLNAATFMVPGWQVGSDAFKWYGAVILPRTKKISVPLQFEVLEGGLDTANQIENIVRYSDYQKSKPSQERRIGSVAFSDNGTVDWEGMGDKSSSTAIALEPSPPPYDAYFMTVFHYASYYGYTYVFDVLFPYCNQDQLKQILDVRDIYGRSLLHWAINRDESTLNKKLDNIVGSSHSLGDSRKETLRTFLGEKPRVFKNEVATLISETTADNKVGDEDVKHLGALTEQIVSYLLKKGADPVAQDNAGRTPLHWACTYLKEEVINTETSTLNQGESKEYFKKNIVSIFDYLTPEQINIGDFEGRTPMHYLGAFRYVLGKGKEKDATERLLQYSVDGNVAGTSAAFVSETAVKVGIVASLTAGVSVKDFAQQQQMEEFEKQLAQAQAALDAGKSLEEVQSIMPHAADFAFMFNTIDDQGNMTINNQFDADVVADLLAASKTKSKSALSDYLVQIKQSYQTMRQLISDTTKAVFVTARTSFAMSAGMTIAFAIAVELVMYFVADPAIKKEIQQNIRKELHNKRDRIMKYLISKGANPNAVDSTEKTPLHYAASMGNSSVVALLLNNGGKILVDKHGMTPAHYAAFSAFTDGAIESLQHIGKQHMRTVADNDLTPMMCAVYSGNYQIIRHLLQFMTIKDFFPEGENKLTLLHHLVMQFDGDAKAMNNALEDIATTVNNFKVKGKSMKDLIFQKDEHGRTPLHYLAANENDKQNKVFDYLVNQLLNKSLSEDPDNYGATLLHMAAASGRENLVKDLVKKYDFEIEAKTGDGQTPLEVARDWGHPSIVEFLAKQADLEKKERKEIKQEAKVEKKETKKEEKASDLERKMAEKEAKKAAKIEKKAHREGWDEAKQADKLDKQTKMKKKKKKLEKAEEPLFVKAARSGNKNDVQAMIRIMDREKDYSDLFSIDTDKKTALIHAVQNGKEKITGYILGVKKADLKALVAMKDNKNKTAYDYANDKKKKKERDKFKAMLKPYM